MASKTTDASEQNLTGGNAPDGLALSDADLKQARKEGAKDDAAEIAKETHRFLTDGQLPGEPVNMRWHGYEETQQVAFWLDRPIDDLINSAKDGYLPDDKVYGLLALERNGQNRTDYVKKMVDYLKLKDDVDKDTSLASVLPGGGPSYTNDTTAITDL